MIKLQSHPLGLQLEQEMCCRKHTRETCPNLRRLLQGFEMQVEEPMTLKISEGNKCESAKRVILKYIYGKQDFNQKNLSYKIHEFFSISFSLSLD
jgi:hypothetical protein